jgi:hypothetical protein
MISRRAKEAYGLHPALLCIKLKMDLEKKKRGFRGLRTAWIPFGCCSESTFCNTMV